MKNIVIICPTQRDRREIEVISRDDSFRHDYIFYGENPREHLADFDPFRFMEGFEKDFEKMPLEGIIGTHDYPGSLLASILCEKYGLDSIGVLPNLLCQHKYYSRMIQKKTVPGAVPGFTLIDPHDPGHSGPPGFPFFIKPVKSFFSIFAGRIDNQEQYEEYLSRFRRSGTGFSRPLSCLMEKYSDLEPYRNHLLAEELIEGKQVTLEGYAYNNKVYFLGITDSVMYPGTISFMRFDYPSRIPPEIEQRMKKVTVEVISAIGINNGMFNIEFFYDLETGDIKIIEINPRMASQFADLAEKVDGTNSYKIQVDLALGRKPRFEKGRGIHRYASSFVLRYFEDKRIKRLPGSKEVQKVLEMFPDTRIEVYGKKGALLSSELQDMQSYRCGIINLGGDSREDLEEKNRECREILGFELERP
jgi:hypothetical protein